MKYIKSPIFWMGNKYDLLYELLPRFPKKEEIDVFVDLFGGGGTISLNVDYNNIIYNELNNNVVDLLMLIKNNEPQIVINHIILHHNIHTFYLKQYHYLVLFVKYYFCYIL